MILFWADTVLPDSQIPYGWILHQSLDASNNSEDLSREMLPGAMFVVSPFFGNYLIYIVDIARVFGS